ncbi:MAG: hypothetical protein J0L59_01415 [Xanthomonadales bacterium]|nr:hypothetical protein [Xanthomonadales bacterium]
MSVKPLPAPKDYARRLRLANRQLRKARELLERTERALHDLPDHQCPTGLLEHIRRFNQAQGGQS